MMAEMNQRADLEKLIAEARANLADYQRVEKACAKQAAALQVANNAAQRKGPSKAKARAMEAVAHAKSKLDAGAKDAAAARVRTTATLQELQGQLDALTEGKS